MGILEPRPSLVLSGDRKPSFDSDTDGRQSACLKKCDLWHGIRASGTGHETDSLASREGTSTKS